MHLINYFHKLRQLFVAIKDRIMVEDLDEISFEDTENNDDAEIVLSSKIVTDTADPDFFSLVRRINKHSLDLQPNFQR